MFSSEARNEIETVAARIGVEAAALLAIAEVESAGRPFATIDGRREPLIRFEGHYFDRRLPLAKRAAAREAGLADPRAGAIRNPASQAARWALLARAAKIDAKAAHESVSWGLGQVMGSHWEWLGYASVDDLVDEARSGIGGQTALMARYIERAGLMGALRARDWVAFARGYNGPAYARNAYDRKMAAAYARYLGTTLPGEAGDALGTLRTGSRGDAVAALQTTLAAAGHPVAVDGLFGPETERAVRALQAASGLSVDGIVGPETRAALERDGVAGTTPTNSGFARLLDWIMGRWGGA